MSELQTIPPEEFERGITPVGTASSIVLPMPIQTNLIVQRQNAVNDVVRHVLRDNEHYGLIPGTGKKTLLKPGFDILCSTFQLAPDFEEMSGTVERDDFINVVYKCQLTHIPSGKVVASGIGSCNSREEKYRWKKQERTCPDCNQATIRQSKEEYGGGFYCNTKDGGCGHKFPKTDERIASQTVGKVENDNPYNFHNTLTKMAQKRAGVAAIITACGLSNNFTQDMEDFEPSSAQVVEGEIVESRGTAVADNQAGTSRSPQETPISTTSRNKVRAALSSAGLKGADVTAFVQQTIQKNAPETEHDAQALIVALTMREEA